MWGFIEWLEIILFSGTSIVGITITMCIYYILYMYCIVVHTPETNITIWHQPNCHPKWEGQLNYICMDKKADEINIVSCIVLFAKNMKTGYVEWSTFYVLGLVGWVIKKLAMSWIMWALAVLLHIVLSMTVCSYVIRFNMYRSLEIFRC